ncbi:DUF2946 family protein [Methylophilus methylotrophus]|uniref:DUF2946 family protein n=1 Tax=Methylophilus methylotrophus TaxID=17 RepID=UPI00039F8062|nr:DUF2946 family protein [Methylophilus methylotrophus]
MLKRFYVSFLLAFLFAIAQTGMVTHEISHIQELTQQSQPDKNHQGNESCTLCISLAHAAGALTQSPQWSLPPQASFPLSTAIITAVSTSRVAIYSARAPPFIISA